MVTTNLESRISNQLISDFPSATRITDPVSTPRPKSMKKCAFFGAPLHSPVMTPQRFAVRTLTDIKINHPIVVPSRPSKVALAPYDMIQLIQSAPINPASNQFPFVLD